jgi:hypothetical protein
VHTAIRLQRTLEQQLVAIEYVNAVAAEILFQDSLAHTSIRNNNPAPPEPASSSSEAGIQSTTMIPPDETCCYIVTRQAPQQDFYKPKYSTTIQAEKDEYFGIFLDLHGIRAIL